MKNILVTGGCGFIGSNFINYVHKHYPDCFILNVDKMDYVSNEKNITNQDENVYKLIKKNLSDKSFNLINYMIEYNIDTIIHFAAQSHVDNSFGNSIQFTYDNVVGTHCLLEHSKKYQDLTNKLKLFLHISTDEVYGEVTLTDDSCSEKSLLNPTNPYAATKAAAEFLVRSYYYSYKLPLIIIRGNNVFGPRQYPEKLIPKFISLLNKGKKCPVQGQGHSRRNFIFVDDVSRALLTIIEKGNVNEIYNIGTNDEYSVVEILDILIKKMNIEKEKIDVIEYVEDRPFNDFRYSIDTSKLVKLGWEKQVSFDKGLDETIKWYKENY
jgi:dTDP-glucose 4,6-dehydratase